MGETAAGLTDLLLGTVLAACAWKAWTVPGLHRYWSMTLWAAATGAYAGVAHHLIFAGSRRSSDLSWVAVGLLVALAISYLLAATAAELVNERMARLFIRIRFAGLGAYIVVLSTVGIGRTLPLVLSESVTMASIVGLWCYGLVVGHPRAGRMLVAIAGCGLSAATMAIPGGVQHAIGMDARSLQHLAQIPGVLLLLRALTLRMPPPADRPAPPASAVRPDQAELPGG